MIQNGNKLGKLMTILKPPPQKNGNHDSRNICQRPMSCMSDNEVLSL